MQCDDYGIFIRNSTGEAKVNSCTILERERRFYMMVMISTDHNHHDHLRSLLAKAEEFGNF
jgi:hypothetical protein